MTSDFPPLRLLYIEDNPLIVFHVEAMVEDHGHIFVGSVASFEELLEEFSGLDINAALVDIDLGDGRTGPAAAGWLQDRGIPSIFVTGQTEVAAEHSTVVLGTVAKPIADQDLADNLGLLLEHLRSGAG